MPDRRGLDGSHQLLPIERTPNVSGPCQSGSHFRHVDWRRM